MQTKFDPKEKVYITGTVTSIIINDCIERYTICIKNGGNTINITTDAKDVIPINNTRLLGDQYQNTNNIVRDATDYFNRCVDNGYPTVPSYVASIEYMVIASPEQMKFIIEGMRNPLNSWNKSDTDYDWYDDICYIGNHDFSLMKRLSKAGTDHRKFMRMMPVYVRITAPFYWWKEFDTYKVGTVANSCSTMHKIQAKEFTVDDFSTEHLISDDIVYLDNHINKPSQGFSSNGNAMMKTTCDLLNQYREKYLKTKNKNYWWQMIQLLPSSYNQTRNVMLNYEVLANIYKSRKDHKLDEWREFCKWIKTLPYSELII